MNLLMEENGAARLVLEASDVEGLELLRDRDTPDLDRAMLVHLFDQEGHIGNNRYVPVGAEEVGALTEAPMFVSDPVYDEHGRLEHYLGLWYFADYQTDSPLEQLLQSGSVTFTRH